MPHAGGTLGRLRRFSYGVRLRLLQVDILLADLDGSAKQRVRIRLAVLDRIRKGDPSRAVQMLRVLGAHQGRVMLTNHISQMLDSVDATSLYLERLGVMLAVWLAAERGHVDGPAVRHVAQRLRYPGAGRYQLAIAIVECGLERVRLVQVHDADLVQSQDCAGGVRQAGAGLGFHGLRSSIAAVMAASGSSPDHALSSKAPTFAMVRRPLLPH